ncbi:MAG: M48 family metallopeptidase [Proteobacteria bacterium]|jgi:STE24 endopeptidase|nr:M48 family metallopeptidase [Pseudomonadota bacterium]
MAIPPLTAAFLVLLAASLAVRTWLAQRQILHVRRHRDDVPAAFIAHIDVAAHRRTADYTIARVHVEQVEIVVDTLALLVLTLGGGVAALARATGALALPPLVQDLALAAAVVVVGGAIALPFSWWRTFGVETRFGFNRCTRKRWAADVAGLAAVTAVLGAPLTAVMLWLMRDGRPAWWLAAWVVWVAFEIALAVLYPALIAPLFNRFTPLPPGALRERVEGLLARCRFGATRLFIADGSRRSSHANAWFAGLGRSRRVVLFDTLLAQLSPDEVEAVLAHEIGHDRLHHVVKRIAWSAAVSLAGLALLAAAMRAPWFVTALGVPAAEVPAIGARPGVTLVLFLLVLPAFTFMFAPLASAWSRRHEFEADAFAAEHASAPALAAALTRLYASNASTLTPDPLYAAFHDSHPSASERVARIAEASA